MKDYKKRELKEVTISGEDLLCGYYALAICIRYEDEIIRNNVYEKLELKKEDIAKINEENDSKFQLSLGKEIKGYFDSKLKSSYQEGLSKFMPQNSQEDYFTDNNISLNQIRYIAKALIPNSEVLIDGQDRKCEYQSNYLKKFYNEPTEFYNEPTDICKNFKINKAKQYILRDIFSSSSEEIMEGKFTFDPHNTNFNFENEIKKFLEIDKIKEKIETDIGEKIEEVEFETLKAILISISDELNKEILKEVNESKKVILYMANTGGVHYTALVVSQQQESTSEKSKENTIVLKSQQQELTSEKLQENTISKEKALPQTQLSKDSQSSSQALNTSLKIPSKERSVQTSSSSIPISSSTMPTSSDSTKKTNHQLLLELIGNKDSSLMQIYSLIREVYKNDELGKINDAGKSLIHIAVEVGNYNVIPAISAMGSKYLNQRIGEVLSDKNEDQIDDKTETKIGDGEKINYQKSIDYGMAPLHLAIKKDHKSEDLKSIKLLLMGKADVNIKKLETQTTPLHYAVCYDKIKLAEILLNNGADIFIKNKIGKDVKDFIYSENHDMKELLEKNLEKSKPLTSPKSDLTYSSVLTKIKGVDHD